MLEAISTNHYRLHGDISMQKSSVLLRELLALPQSATKTDIHLDVSALEFADSLLLAVLMDLQRQLKKNKQRLYVGGLQDGMLGLARVYGIETLLDSMMEAA